MAWRTILTVIAVIFALAVVQMVLAPPLTQVTEGLNESGNHTNEHFDGNSLIGDVRTSWFNMGLVGMFGVMTWGLVRILRREITRGRGGL